MPVGEVCARHARVGLVAHAAQEALQTCVIHHFRVRPVRGTSSLSHLAMGVQQVVGKETNWDFLRS